MVDNIVISCMETDGSHTCGERSITYELVELLCCPPETKVTLDVSYTQIKKKRKSIVKKLALS